MFVFVPFILGNLFVGSYNIYVPGSRVWLGIVYPYIPILRDGYCSSSPSMLISTFFWPIEDSRISIGPRRKFWHPPKRHGSFSPDHAPEGCPHHTSSHGGCELLGRMPYHFSFALQNPSAQSMPFSPELNVWKIHTLNLCERDSKGMGWWGASQKNTILDG